MKVKIEIEIGAKGRMAQLEGATIVQATEALHDRGRGRDMYQCRGIEMVRAVVAAVIGKTKKIAAMTGTKKTGIRIYGQARVILPEIGRKYLIAGAITGKETGTARKEM